MTLAVIVLASALALAVGGMIATGLWLRDAHKGRAEAKDETAEAKDETAREKDRAEKLREERDQAVVKAVELETEKHELERRLGIAEDQRNTATKEAAEHAATAIRNAPTVADSLAALREQLQEPILPEASGSDPTAAGGEHDGGAPTVQPAGPATDADADRGT